MIENPQIGQRVWVQCGAMGTPVECEIKSHIIDFTYRVRVPKGTFNRGTILIDIANCYPSLKAFLAHLSDTAIPLPTEGENKA